MNFLLELIMRAFITATGSNGGEATLLSEYQSEWASSNFDPMLLIVCFGVSS